MLDSVSSMEDWRYKVLNMDDTSEDLKLKSVCDEYAAHLRQVMLSNMAAGNENNLVKNNPEVDFFVKYFERKSEEIQNGLTLAMLEDWLDVFSKINNQLGMPKINSPFWSGSSSVHDSGMGPGKNFNKANQLVTSVFEVLNLREKLLVSMEKSALKYEQYASQESKRHWEAVKPPVNPENINEFLGRIKNYRNANQNFQIDCQKKYGIWYKITHKNGDVPRNYVVERLVGIDFTLSLNEALGMKSESKNKQISTGSPSDVSDKVLSPQNAVSASEVPKIIPEKDNKFSVKLSQHWK